MPCRECHVIHVCTVSSNVWKHHTNTMSSTLCSDCGIKLRKENEKLEAEWLEIALESDWKRKHYES